jgi:hypothetical protein
MSHFLKTCIGFSVSGAWLLNVSSAFAQSAQVGVTPAVVFVFAEDSAGGLAGAVGAEACFPCSGRFGLVGNYQRWWRSASTSGGIEGGTAATIALRIQRSPARNRTFVDVGYFGGHVRFITDTAPLLCEDRPEGRFCRFDPDAPRIRSHGRTEMRGVAVGIGRTVLVGERWYVSPQCRIHLAVNRGVSVSAGVGAGMRF